VERTVRAVAGGRDYQRDPEGSAVIFRRLAAGFRKQGLHPLDPFAFGRYRAGGAAWVRDEYRLDGDVAEVASSAVGRMAGGKVVAIKVVSRIAGFVRANPGRELAAVFVPTLCDGLGVGWWYPGEEDAGRCKKGERLLARLVAVGLLHVERQRVWLGPRNTDNRAPVYGLGPVLAGDGQERVDREGGSASTLTDTSVPSRFAPLLAEQRRLRRRTMAHRAILARAAGSAAADSVAC